MLYSNHLNKELRSFQHSCLVHFFFVLRIFVSIPTLISSIAGKVPLHLEDNKLNAWSLEMVFPIKCYRYFVWSFLLFHGNLTLESGELLPQEMSADALYAISRGGIRFYHTAAISSLEGPPPWTRSHTCQLEARGSLTKMAAKMGKFNCR